MLPIIGINLLGSVIGQISVGVVSIVARHVIGKVFLQLNGQATIDHQAMSGDKRSFVCAEEVDGIGNVVWFPGPAQGVLCFDQP